VAAHDHADAVRIDFERTFELSRASPMAGRVVRARSASGVPALPGGRVVLNLARSLTLRHSLPDLTAVTGRVPMVTMFTELSRR
jgi:hypothetical protein